jgi:hypothetical protein
MVITFLEKDLQTVMEQLMCQRDDAANVLRQIDSALGGRARIPGMGLTDAGMGWVGETLIRDFSQTLIVGGRDEEGDHSDFPWRPSGSQRHGRAVREGLEDGHVDGVETPGFDVMVVAADDEIYFWLLDCCELL